MPALLRWPPTHCHHSFAGAGSSVAQRNVGACSPSPAWSAAATAPPERMTPRKLTYSLWKDREEGKCHKEGKTQS